MITPELREKVRHAAKLKFHFDDDKPNNQTTFLVEGRDINAICIAWVQANPAMRQLFKLHKSVADEEKVLLELM